METKQTLTIYKDGFIYYTKKVLLQLLKHDDVLIIAPYGFGDNYEGAAGEFGTYKPSELSDEDILYNVTRVHGGYVKLADKGFGDFFGIPVDDVRHEVEIINVKESLGE